MLSIVQLPVPERGPTMDCGSSPPRRQVDAAQVWSPRRQASDRAGHVLQVHEAHRALVRRTRQRPHPSNAARVTRAVRGRPGYPSSQSRLNSDFLAFL